MKEKIDEKKLTVALDTACDYLAEHLGKNVPQSGDFSPHGIRFSVYHTKNTALMRIEHHTTAPKDERSLSLHVVRDGYDRAYTHFLFKGSNEQLIAALCSKERRQEYLQDVKALSERIDDYYD